MPGFKRAEKMFPALLRLAGVKSAINVSQEGYVDNRSLVGDPTMLRLLAMMAVEEYAGKRVTKILTAAVDGVPVATAISMVMGVPLVVAKRYREVGISEFLEAYVVGDDGTVVTWYVPRDAITPPGQRVDRG